MKTFIPILLIVLAGLLVQGCAIGRGAQANLFNGNQALTNRSGVESGPGDGSHQATGGSKFAPSQPTGTK